MSTVTENRRTERLPGLKTLNTTPSLSENISINLLSLFKPIVHIYSFISFGEYYLLINPIIPPPQDISPINQTNGHLYFFKIGIYLLGFQRLR